MSVNYIKLQLYFRHHHLYKLVNKLNRIHMFVVIKIDFKTGNKDSIETRGIEEMANDSNENYL